MSAEQYGIDVASHQVIQDSFPNDMLLTDVLQSFGVDQAIIDTIDSRSSSQFDVRRMQAGKPFTILKNNVSKDVDFFIYEETDENYVVIDFREGIDITRGQKSVEKELKSLYLPITTTLYEAITDKGADPSLVKSLEQIFSWQVDFFQMDAGDYCQVIFEERFVDGSFIGIGQVQAAHFHQGSEDYFAFYYPMEGKAHFYDEKGNHLRTAFLPAPLGLEDSKNPSPSKIDKRSKEQFYVSPDKRPVLAVGSGQIISVKKRGDGMSLLLRHSNVFSTQYLHLSTLAEGIETNREVTQGDTLGYTGKLPGINKSGVGLRYWKQGRPSLPPKASEQESPASQGANPEFLKRISLWKKQLAEISMTAS
ncbi:MAG: peptidoglycan DD-metalloendopeptidase family protein [Bacteroidia bacterium]|nr:peptidoglycan DD-metalloendopeptidase family protein [Bacteroidia bacterium]